MLVLCIITSIICLLAGYLKSRIPYKETKQEMLNAECIAMIPIIILYTLIAILVQNGDDGYKIAILCLIIIIRNKLEFLRNKSKILNIILTTLFLIIGAGLIIYTSICLLSPRHNYGLFYIAINISPAFILILPIYCMYTISIALSNNPQTFRKILIVEYLAQIIYFVYGISFHNDIQVQCSNVLLVIVNLILLITTFFVIKNHKTHAINIPKIPIIIFSLCTLVLTIIFFTPPGKIMRANYIYGMEKCKGHLDSGVYGCAEENVMCPICFIIQKRNYTGTNPLCDNCANITHRCPRCSKLLESSYPHLR